MKKITLILILIVSFGLSNAQKVYRSGGYVYVEDQTKTAFNPSQSTYYILDDRCILRDDINGIHKVLFFDQITDSLGVKYESEKNIRLFFENNLIQSNKLYSNDGEVTNENPLPSKDIDNSHRHSFNTIFGDKIVGTRITYIGSQFQYGIQEGTSEGEFLNGGSYEITKSLLKLQTGTNPNGSASLQSTETVRYVPGQEVYCIFTVVYDTAVDNSYQRVGLFDNRDGFYVGYENQDFVFARKRDSVTYTNTIDIDLFNSLNNYNYLPQLGNVYRISYGYLGFATVNLELMKDDGSWLLLSQIKYPNSSTKTHTTQTFLPVRGEVGNTGNTTNIELYSGSLSAGIVDGGMQNVAGREFTWATDSVILFSNDATLVTFRNKDTFNGIKNKVPARLLLISGASNSNKNLRWRLIKNPTLQASPVPVWVDVDSNNSTLEYSINAVVNYELSKDYFLAFNTGGISDFFRDVEKYFLDLPPGATGSFVIYSKATNAEIDLSIRWIELF